jgi:hypothetical protein
MIGVPMPDPRDKITADLNQQINNFFAAGLQIQEIPRGVSADAPFFGTTTHSEKLRALRDTKVPELQRHADAGLTIAEAAKAMGIHVKSIALIAKENGIKIKPKR